MNKRYNYGYRGFNIRMEKTRNGWVYEAEDWDGDYAGFMGKTLGTREEAQRAVEAEVDRILREGPI